MLALDWILKTASESPTASTIALRDASGDLAMQSLKMENEMKCPVNSTLTDPTITCVSDGDTGINFDGAGEMTFISNATEIFNLGDIADIKAFGTINTAAATATLALTDANDFIQCTSATAMNLTVPPNSSVAFVVGTVIDVLQHGAGTVTMVAGAGVTLRSAGGLLAISAQYAGLTLKKLATDEWSVVGSLA